MEYIDEINLPMQFANEFNKETMEKRVVERCIFDCRLKIIVEYIRCPLQKRIILIRNYILNMAMFLMTELYNSF